MQDQTGRSQEQQDQDARREDEPMPTASEDRVLEETARLAREGRRQLESDPKEPKPGV
jgi:hypothetical protein